MTIQVPEDIEKPSWNQATIWTGADLFALLRILNANRWRVHPLYSPGVLIDLGFAAGNSGLKLLQWIIYGRRIRRTRLPDDPIFIIGHWRTGTTLLHELLTLDPNHTFPTTYQCFAANHFLLSERFLKPWSGFALPRSRPPDNMQINWDSPQEDEFALCNLGLPSPYAMIAFPNRPLRYRGYLDLDSVTEQQRRRWKRALLRFIRQVYYRRPGRMVLKSPPHTFHLPTLLELFPRARFVHLARHPAKVIPSTERLWKSLFTTHAYQKPTFEGLDEFVLETFAQMHRRYHKTRDLVPPEQLIELRYEDLVADQSATVRMIYERFQLGDFEGVRAKVDEYVKSRADYQPNRYHLDAETRDRILETCRPYCETHGYDMEVEEVAEPEPARREPRPSE